MSENVNDLTEDLLALLKTGTDLDHMVTFVPWLHEMAEPTIKKSARILHQRGGPANSFGPMTASAIINVFHDGEWVTRAPTGSRVTVGGDVGRMAEEVAGRMNASLITVLHETWEVFVKRTYGKLLFHLKDELSPPNRADFHTKTPNWRTYRNTPSYFQDYAQWSCRTNCDEALRVFREQLAWDEIRVHGLRCIGMDWLTTAKTLASCRHCVVHNEGWVSQRCWKRLNKQQKAFVGSMMKKTILSDRERILPSAKIIDWLIEAVMSFAYGLYVLQSKKCGLEVEHVLFKKMPRPEKGRLRTPSRLRSHPA
jgi:hypothetical protein